MNLIIFNNVYKSRNTGKTLVFAYSDKEINKRDIIDKLSNTSRQI